VKSLNLKSKTRNKRPPLVLVSDQPNLRAVEHFYRATERGLVLVNKNGTAELLTNFIAEIVGDTLIDDGATVTRTFEIQVTFKNTLLKFELLASEFSKMNWPVEKIGAAAIITVGRGHRDHARAAIQGLSNKIITHYAHAHTGWQQVNGAWVFLHGGGAIGAEGVVHGIDVRLPDALSNYVLPAPNSRKLVSSIRATLNVLSVAPLYLTVPLLGAVFRVVLGPCDFSIHVTGQTGTGKSELAALIQQHFGPRLDARNLPTSWSSTANANEALAFYAKDCIIVVDDFLPSGTTYDVQHLHAGADRLMRNQGNRAARQRLTADSSLMPAKAPRGVIISTGEDTPRGQSLRARLLVLEMAPDSMNWAALTHCQREALRGCYAHTTAGYTQWLARRYAEIQRRLPGEIVSLRNSSLAGASHRRTVDIISNLWLGWRYFLDFAKDLGAINPKEVEHYTALTSRALEEGARTQGEQQSTNDPAIRFVQLVSAALSNGSAHLAGPDGMAPEKPEAYGWRLFKVGTGDNERDDWRFQGSRIGWLEGDDVFLNSDAAYKAAQVIAKDLGEPLAITLTTLLRRLRDRGSIATTDLKRQTLTIRKVLEGVRREMLHMKLATFFPEVS